MASSADPARFHLARFLVETLGPALHRLEEMERRLEPDPSDHGPEPPSSHAVDSVTAEAVEAASIACLGAEVGTFPADDVAAALDSGRATFEAIARRIAYAPSRVSRDTRAELLVHGDTRGAVYLRTVPDAADPVLARATFQSAWLAMRALRRDGPGKRLLEALRDPDDDRWLEITGAAIAAIEPLLLADSIESIDASAIDALWPLDATVATVGYLEGLRAWRDDLAPDLLAVAGAVAQAHAWRFDLTTTPASARWGHAVRLTTQAIRMLGPRLLDVEPERLPWPEDFDEVAKRAATAWTLLSAQLVPQLP